MGVARSGSANPVLTAPEFARCLLTSPPFSQQYSMDFFEQTQRERKAFFYSGQSVPQGCHIIAHFLNIIQGNARLSIDFIKKEVGK